MFARFFQLFRRYYHQMIGSISFVPAILALLFLLVAVLIAWLDASVFGDWILERIPVLRLRDAGTARTILSTVAAGIISLTVFSFSLVMIMLNQAASNLTNRLLEGLVREKFHQTIMGIYIGTIVFSLVSLFQVREIGNGDMQIPSISISIAILLGIVDIFLFIYFLHYVTQSVKFSNVIQKIYQQTLRHLNSTRRTWVSDEEYRDHQEKMDAEQWQSYPSLQTGYLQDAQEESLVAMAKELDIVIRMEHHFGNFIFQDTPLYAVQSGSELDEETQKRINYAMDFYWSENIDENTLYGYRQLSEIAIRALSPGINDPGTAIQCMNALGELLAKRMAHTEQFCFADADENPRFFIKVFTFEELFKIAFDPIINYGKADGRVLDTFFKIVNQLMLLDAEKRTHATFFKHYLMLIRDLAEEHIGHGNLKSRITAQIDEG